MRSFPPRCTPLVLAASLCLSGSSIAQDVSGLANLAKAIDGSRSGASERVRQDFRTASEEHRKAEEGSLRKRIKARQLEAAFEAWIADRRSLWGKEKTSTGREPSWNPEDLRAMMNAGKGLGTLDPADPDYDGSQDVRALNQKYKSGPSSKAVAYAWDQFRLAYQRQKNPSARWPNPQEGQKDWSAGNLQALKESYLAWRVLRDQRTVALPWMEEKAKQAASKVPSEREMGEQLATYLSQQGATAAAIRTRAARDWPAVLQANRAAARGALEQADAEAKARQERAERERSAKEAAARRTAAARVRTRYRKPFQAVQERLAMTVVTEDEAESRANLKRLRSLLQQEAPFRNDPDFQKLIREELGVRGTLGDLIKKDAATWVADRMAPFEAAMEKFTSDERYQKALATRRRRDEDLREKANAVKADAEAALEAEMESLRAQAEALGGLDTAGWPYKTAQKKYAKAQEYLGLLVEAAERATVRTQVLEEILAEDDSPTTRTPGGSWYIDGSRLSIQGTLDQRLEGNQAHRGPSRDRLARLLAELEPLEAQAREKKAGAERQKREDYLRKRELERQHAFYEEGLAAADKLLTRKKAEVDAAVEEAVETGVTPADSFANKTLEGAFVNQEATKMRVALLLEALRTRTRYDAASMKRLYQSIDDQVEASRSGTENQEYLEFVRSRDARARSGAAATRAQLLRGRDANLAMLAQRSQSEPRLLESAWASARKAIEAHENAKADLADQEALLQARFWEAFDATPEAMDPAARAAAAEKIRGQIEALRQKSSGTLASLKEKCDQLMEPVIAGHQNIDFVTRGSEIYQGIDRDGQDAQALSQAREAREKLAKAYLASRPAGEKKAREAAEALRRAIQEARRAARGRKQTERARQIDARQKAEAAALRKRQAEETERQLAATRAAYEAKMAAWKEKKAAYEAARKKDANLADENRRRLAAYRVSRRVAQGEAESWEDYEAAVRALEGRVVALEAAFGKDSPEIERLESQVQAGLARAAALRGALKKARAKRVETGN